ncbi:MAG: hypothetical protein IT384_11520 [Deltaproteobacteria bacterium]|nr:hypothetical protein [Deltaproteobacteria bacterium]
MRRRYWLGFLGLWLISTPVARAVELDPLEPRVESELLKDGISLERLGLRLDLQDVGAGCLVEILDTSSGKSVGLRKIPSLPDAADPALAQLTVVVAEMVREARPDQVSPAAAAPAASPPEKPKGVLVHIDSDDPNVELYEHLGTSVGRATNGVAVMAVHVERRCKSPCDRRLDLTPDHEYFLDGSGVSTSNLFTLDPNVSEVRMKVDAGNSTVRGLGAALVYLGAATALTGATFGIVGTAIGTDEITGTSGAFTTIGWSMLGGGLGGVAIGLVLALTSGTDFELEQH